MSKETLSANIPQAVEPINSERKQSRDISLRGILAIYTAAGLAASAALIANNQFDKAAYVLGWTGLSAAGLLIKE